MTDPIGEPVDPVHTEPETEPAIPTLASLLPAKVRFVLYAVLGFASTAVGIFAAVNESLNKWLGISILLVNAAGFSVSAANVPVRTRSSR